MLLVEHSVQPTTKPNSNRRYIHSTTNGIRSPSQFTSDTGVRNVVDCVESAALTTMDWDNLNIDSWVMSTDHAFKRLMIVLLNIPNTDDAWHEIGVEKCN